jgi:hypothetical protein
MNQKTHKKIELMYRSSKMNEEKMNVMRANMPLPDINDVDGKDSIIRYLPPINNLNAVISLKVLSVKKETTTINKFCIFHSGVQVRLAQPAFKP